MAKTILQILDPLAESVGAFVRISFEAAGAMGMLLIEALFRPWSWALIVEQCYLLGIKSLGLVGISAMFTGAISAFSVAYMTGGLFLNYLGTAVLKAVLIEMGPTFTALILTGRIGATIAAEVGSMRITEQIDALTCLSLDPIKHLVTPRIIACLIMGPILFVYSSVIAIVSAQLAATFVFQLEPFVYYNSARLLFSYTPIILGLVKSFVFCGLIGLCSAYFGYNTRGGAAGVGVATRAAVTSGALSVLASNAIITKLFT